jgi:hypothetical protein
VCQSCLLTIPQFKAIGYTAQAIHYLIKEAGLNTWNHGQALVSRCIPAVIASRESTALTPGNNFSFRCPLLAGYTV